MSAMPLELSADGTRLTVHIPIAIKYRRGRRTIVLPDVDQMAERTPKAVERPLVKAIARAHRWKRLLEAGEFASVTELAAAEKINHTYLCRVLRLTLLAPDIIEAILDGRQPSSLDLNLLLKPFPHIWEEQRPHFGIK